MQYKQEIPNKLITSLNILHNLCVKQAYYEKNLYQQKSLFFTKKVAIDLKRKKLRIRKLRGRYRTIEQLAKNKLINTMRATYLY